VQHGSTSASADVPYLTVERPGARHLLVGFAGLRPGGASPPRSLPKRFPGLDAHWLLLGADRHTYIGPRREMAGLRAAAKLTRQEAARLEVPSGNVVTIGSSMGAVCALVIGLDARVARVVAGAPPVLDLFVSPTDRTYKQVRWLEERLAGHELVEVRVTRGDYSRHADIEPAFAEHVLQTLRPLCGLASPA
jgi:hypothetical protein